MGHFGLINLLVYFLVYSPFALLMPTYYMARLWSLLLILGINTFVFLDALSFSTYHLHVYGHISEFFLKYGHHYLIGPDPAKTILLAGVLVVAVFIWLRGDSVWRHMQGRFSNPVGSWYIVLIVVSGLLGRVLYYYGDIQPKLAEMFPLNLNLLNPEKVHTHHGKLYYPSEALSCPGSADPNLVLIVVKNFSKEDLLPEGMPVTLHLKDHAFSYDSHLATGFNAKEGLYSLLYSLPASYESISDNSSPAFIQVMKKRNYEILNLNDQDSLNSWAKERADTLKPFYLSFILDKTPVEADAVIHKLVVQLQKENLLENTHILITGAYSGKSTFVPLIWSMPERKRKVVNHLTSHYDVMPTLMEKFWGCKKTFETASTGKSLDIALKDWLLISGQDKYEILDIKNDSRIYVEHGQISETRKKTRAELIFSSLKLMTKFMRPH